MLLFDEGPDWVEGNVTLGFPDNKSSYMGKYNLFLSKHADPDFGIFYMLRVVGKDKKDKHYQFDFDLDESQFDHFLEMLNELKKREV